MEILCQATGWVEVFGKFGNLEETQTENKQKQRKDVVLNENKISLENVLMKLFQSLIGTRFL